jgi:hypothetical protein
MRAQCQQMGRANGAPVLVAATAGTNTGATNLIHAYKPALNSFAPFLGGSTQCRSVCVG